ncbi:hypothetical protein BGZ96_004363 [Linnemannia gamsii]|uniref:Uncharacterized protein n=1 Tax=Linnemannia gamsii TaxID=64522 RepID=A0ABQ7K718_9FUNG|nr:hypothetical protein BGZ96_004363 [Linnemannia gamsii]
MLPLLESYHAPGLPHGPDPAAFVRQCPNLVRLALVLDTGKGYYKDDMDITCLADSLRQFCPNLRALNLRGYITPDQKAILIRNCTANIRGLSELVVDVYTMGKNLMDSMAAHAPTLETLGILTTTDGETVRMRYFLQLSVQCPQLKWFAVHACYNRESAGSILGALKTANWQCPTMEVLDLNVGDPSEEQLEDKVLMLREVFATGPILGCLPARLKTLVQDLAPFNPFTLDNYNAEGMERVPVSILRNNSSHFRTFSLQRGQLFFKFVDCTRLVSLTLNSNTADIGDSRQIIRSNPGLRFLTWNGPTNMLRLPTDEFVFLTRFERLALSFWNVSEGRIGKVLKPMAGSIKELEISWLTGLRVSGVSKKARRRIHAWNLSVPMVSPLALIQLNLDIDIYKDDMNIIPIAIRLCAYCPKLWSLAVSGTIAQGLKATLIRSIAMSNNLSMIIVALPIIDKDVVESIALHASVLTTLGILSTTKGPAELYILFQLPVLCSRLKQFSVAAGFCCETGPAVLDAIRATVKRRSSEMEVLGLDIGDIKEASSYAADASTLEVMFEDEPVMGWHYHAEEVNASYKAHLRLSRAFVKDMFESVADLESLWLLRWCGAVFTRSRRPVGTRFERLPFIHLSGNWEA